MKFSRVFDSIVTRLLLLALGIVIVGTVVRYFALSNLLREDLSALVERQQLTLAEYAARDVELKISQRQTLLDYLAAHLPPSLLAHPEQLHAWLRAHHQEQQFFSAGLIVLDQRGTVLADCLDNRAWAQHEIVGRDYIEAGLAGRSYVGRPQPGRTPDEVLLPMAVPIRDKTQALRGVLVGLTALGAPGFLDALQQSRLDPEAGRSVGEVFLISPRDQLIIAASPPQASMVSTPSIGVDALHDRAMAGFRGVGLTTSARGVEEVSAIASVPSVGWFVDVRLPTAEAFAALPRLQRFLIDKAAVAILVFLILASSGLYFIFRPLFRAAKLAERMACNEIPLKALPVVRNDEIGHLIAAFNRLLLKLDSNQAELQHLAHFDLLTSLPNRVLLSDRLHQVMLQTQRNEKLLAVAYLDLDGFKEINDTYGHATGDQVLIELASRLKQSLREGDTLARLGGDEFVAVLLDQNDVATCRPILDRMLAAAAGPLNIGGRVLEVSASIGVTLYPQAEAVDADQLLRQADQAMYKAKLLGKNCYSIFDADHDRSLRSHNESLEHIRNALARREFVLYYQPKVNMRSGAVMGAEALIRWRHPERGLLSPAAFLPLIEEHQLAVEIGEWVIASALAQMERWQAAGLNIAVSVNVGARQLQQPDFVQRLRESLAAHPTIRPRDLELEVLETSALEDLSRVSRVIEACREIGVMFALDDFGTGYSSLTYLKHLPVAQLKIDQSFVRDMLVDPDDLAILGGVLGLANSFRRQVIAEGVETIEHGEMLLQLGCELAQGYGIARPMPAADFPAWTRQWQMDPAWRHVRRVSRDDFPLLFAGIEHRAWIALVESQLEDGQPLPSQTHQQCRFGAWLAAEGEARFAAQPLLQSVERLHQQIHARVAELSELSELGQATDREASDRHPELPALLSELHDLQLAFASQLKSLLAGQEASPVHLMPG
jgi:diguanylate cyclase (GGDEF)-like protein